MKYRYIESPNTMTPFPKGMEVIFLAGGITNCINWQARATEVLANLPVVICNPRRKVWDLIKAEKIAEQIQWEFLHLEIATQIIFWFERDVTQPIALFELGTRIRGNKPIFIGTHPEYPRRFDIITQAPLYGYNSIIFDDMERLLKAVVDYNHLHSIVIPKS